MIGFLQRSQDVASQRSMHVAIAGTRAPAPSIVTTPQVRTVGECTQTIATIGLAGGVQASIKHPANTVAARTNLKPVNSVERSARQAPTAIQATIVLQSTTISAIALTSAQTHQRLSPQPHLPMRGRFPLTIGLSRHKHVVGQARLMPEETVATCVLLFWTVLLANIVGVCTRTTATTRQ